MSYRLSLICLLMAGCSSANTTFLQTDECGNLYKCPEHHRRGVPVMVPVPTHIEVAIVQKDMWKIEGKGLDAKKLVHVPAATTRRAEIETIQTEQMFLVDPKRPVSGSGMFGFTYGGTGEDVGKGYLTKVNYKAVDTTIKDSAKLITTALSAVGVLTANDGTGSASPFDGVPSLVWAERTVAYRRFAIGSNVQAEVDQLIAEYINNCSGDNCSVPTTYAQ